MNVIVWGVVVDFCVWVVVLVCGMNVIVCELVVECSEVWFKFVICDVGMVKESVVGVLEFD